MSTIELGNMDFRVLAGQILADGHRLRFTASGSSMHPFIQDGDLLEVAPLSTKRVSLGDVLLVESAAGRLLAHRVVKIRRLDGTSQFLVKSDASRAADGWFQAPSILGRVDKLEHEGKSINLASAAQRGRAVLWVIINPWIVRLFWLPARLRRFARHWLINT